MFEVKKIFRDFRVLDVGQNRNRKLGNFGNFIFSTCYLLASISANISLLLNLEPQLRAERTNKKSIKVDQGYDKFI